MVAYNFQARFVAAIETGDKAITIRTIGRRRHARIGERLQLYTGQRTKACRKLVDPDPVVTRAAHHLSRGWPCLGGHLADGRRA